MINRSLLAISLILAIKSISVSPVWSPATPQVQTGNVIYITSATTQSPTYPTITTNFPTAFTSAPKMGLATIHI